MSMTGKEVMDRLSRDIAADMSIEEMARELWQAWCDIGNRLDETKTPENGEVEETVPDYVLYGAYATLGFMRIAYAIENEPRLLPRAKKDLEAALGGVFHVFNDYADAEVVPRDELFPQFVTEYTQWAEETFGPGRRTMAIIDHIQRELREIAAAPDDLEEWVDVILLGINGAARTGATGEQVYAALRAKLAKNRTRKWPDWRNCSGDKAIEHIREEA